MLEEKLERDLFLLKEIDDDTAGEIIKSIIKINVYDAEQENKVIGYKRKPIRLHICSPRRVSFKWICNL